MFLSDTIKLYQIKAIIHKLVFSAIIVVIGMLGIVTVKGADTAKGYGDDYSHTYALRVQTGTTSGNGNIGTFIVNYKDPNGTARRVYINPYDGDYYYSFKYITDHGNGKTADENQKKFYSEAFGYKLSEQGDLGTHVLPPAKDQPALTTGNIDTFIFETDYDVSEIISVGVMTGNGKNGGKSWSCNELSVFKVDEIYGFLSYGYASNSSEVAFRGSCLASMTYENISGSKSSYAEFMFDGNGVYYLTSNAQTAISSITTAKLELKNQPYDNFTLREEYTIKVDIADVYMAGFEGYIAKNKTSAKLSDIKPAEALVLRLDYLTPSGYLRIVNIPVVTSALYYAYQSGAISTDTELADIIGQSGSLALTARLPEFSSVYNATLYYVSGETKSLAGETSVEFFTGMTYETYDALGKHEAYHKAMWDDKISVSGIQIYQSNNAVSVSLNGASLKVTENSGAKMLCYTQASTSNGFTLGAGESHALTFVDAEGKTAASLKNDSRQLYIFEAKTSDLINSGTVSDIAAIIKYIDTADNEQEFEFRFTEGEKNFYGYWPDAEGNDAGYRLCMQQGSYFYALLEIDSVKKIVGLSLNNKDSDDWLAESISIYQVEDNNKIGGIHYEWNSDSNGPSVLHGREINGTIITSQTDLKSLLDTNSNMGVSTLVSIGGASGDEDDPNASAGIYIDGNMGRDINFTSVEVGQLKDTRTDIFEYMFDMPYEVANSYFGFDSKKETYTVDVKVASDPYGLYQNGRYDDCGSTNYFYFQLVFEHGNSAYVQANQQMESDSFRSGETESFKIYLNQDYGALQAVKIIPEVDIDTGNPYDKLNIEYVAVTRTADSGLAQTFYTDNIQWIGIDYSDKGGSTKYHKADQLAKTYPFVKETNKANLLFTIGYDSIPEGYSQFQGTLSAYITYKKTDGTSDVKELDLGRAMHEFNGTIGVADVSKKTTQDGTTKLIETDPNLMCRSNHIDRFVWSAEDIKYVERMKLVATNLSGKQSYIDITDVSISVINSGSVDKDRSMNRAGEYIIDPLSATEIVTSDKGKHEMLLGNDATSSLMLTFENDESTCISAIGGSSSPYIVSRVPATENDTVNVYAYISNTSYNYSNLTVSGEVDYSTEFGASRTSPDTFRLTTIIDENGTSRQAYCTEGLSVKGFSTLEGIGLIASGSGGDLGIDYIIIQHVKNNVVVDCYKAIFPVAGANIIGVKAYTDPNGISKFKNTQGYQEVTLQIGDITLGENDTETTLTPEYRDIAVSFGYMFGNTESEFFTENYYLTSSGMRSLKPGQVIKFITYNSNIGQITKLSLSATGYLGVEIKAATVGVYNPIDSGSEDEVTYECTNWYSFECNQWIENETKAFGVNCNVFDSENTLSTITMDIKTMTSFTGENGNFGSDVGLTNDQKLKMTITYEENGQLKELTFDNIVDKLKSGDFSAGSTATFSFIAKNLRYDNIKKVVFVPYDDVAETNIVWGIDTLDIDFGEGTTQKNTINVEPRKIIFETEEVPKEISFARVVLSAKVERVEPTFVAGNTNAIASSTVLEDLGTVTQTDATKITIKNHSAKQVYKITVTVQNSTMKYTAEAGTDFTNYQTTEEVLYYSFDGAVGENKTVKIMSEENPECFVDVTFVIDSKEAVTVNSTNTDKPAGTLNSTNTEKTDSTSDSKTESGAATGTNN